MPYRLNFKLSFVVRWQKGQIEICFEILLYLTNYSKMFEMITNNKVFK